MGLLNEAYKATGQTLPQVTTPTNASGGSLLQQAQVSVTNYKPASQVQKPVVKQQTGFLQQAQQKIGQIGNTAVSSVGNFIDNFFTAPSVKSPIPGSNTSPVNKSHSTITKDAIKEVANYVLDQVAPIYDTDWKRKDIRQKAGSILDALMMSQTGTSAIPQAAEYTFSKTGAAISGAASVLMNYLNDPKHDLKDALMHPENVAFTFIGGIHPVTREGGKALEETVRLSGERVRNEVLTSDLAKTPAGKELLKASFEADRKGQVIEISKQKEGVKVLETPQGNRVSYTLVDTGKSTPLDVNKLEKGYIEQDANSSLLTSDMSKEATPHQVKVQEKLKNLQENIDLRRADNEQKKPILDQFSGEQIQAMRTIKRSIEALDNKGQNIESVMSTKSYKNHIWDVMSAIGTNSEQEALRFIREDLPDPLVSATTREELSQIKVLKSHLTPQEVSVPRTNLPVGTGEMKVSRLEARMKNTLGNLTQDKIDELGLSTFQKMNKEEQIAQAAEYVASNQKDALRVIKGEIDPPKGLIPESIYVALTKQAEGDITLSTKLASLQATALGQRIGILTELDPHSPVKIMNDVIKLREQEVQRRYTGKNIKEVENTMVEEAQKQVKKPNKYDWETFIDSLQC